MLSCYRHSKVPHHLAVTAALALVIGSASNYWYSNSHTDDGAGMMANQTATTSTSANADSKSGNLLLDLGFFLIGL